MQIQLHSTFDQLVFDPRHARDPTNITRKITRNITRRTKEAIVVILAQGVGAFDIFDSLQ